MDSTFVAALQRLCSQSAIEKATAHLPPEIKVALPPVALVPEGFRLVNLEGMLPRPVRQNPMMIVVEDGALEPFCRLVNEFRTERTKIFIYREPDRLRVRAHLEFPAPGVASWDDRIIVMMMAGTTAEAIRDIHVQTKLTPYLVKSVITHTTAPHEENNPAPTAQDRHQTGQA